MTVKIAKIEQYSPRPRMRLVKVTTDDGTIGWGARAPGGDRRLRRAREPDAGVGGAGGRTRLRLPRQDGTGARHRDLPRTEGDAPDVRRGAGATGECRRAEAGLGPRPLPDRDGR